MGNEKSSRKFIEFAEAFIKEAKEDVAVAEELLENKRYAHSVFMSQQCAEKAVKAMLEIEGIFVAEHDISTFFLKFIANNNVYKKYKKENSIILEDLDYFEGEWAKTRYPKEKNGKICTPTELYGEKEAFLSLEKAKEVYNLIKKIMDEKNEN